MIRRLLPLFLLLVAAGNPFGCGPITDSPQRDTDTGPDAPPGQLAQAVGGVPTGSLSTNRSEFQLLRLPDGRALALGSAGQSCELYSPAAGTWSLTGSMLQTPGRSAAVVLQDGRVLVAGIYSNYSELYDPTTGTWSMGADLPMPIGNTHAAVLPDGRVLVVGEQTQLTAFFEPATGTWTAAPPRNTTSSWLNLSSLPDGRVVVVGAMYADVFDPATSVWTRSNLSTLAERWAHSSIALTDGRVLITGGYNAVGTYLATAAIFDPATGTFSATGPMSSPRIGHSLVRLPDGKVLVFGGKASADIVLDTVEHFDPATGTFTTRAKMATPRAWHRALALGDGRVLVAGGSTGTAPNAELYDPADCYTSCAQLNKNCGTVSDACGGTLECGTCGGGLTCNANVCGDITPPVVTFTAPRTDIFLSNTVTVSATATDAVGAVRAELLVDNIPRGTLQGPGPYTWSWDTRTYPATRLTVKVYDAAGNLGVTTRDVQIRNAYSSFAYHDSTYRVPRCSYASSCDSGSLLVGRAALGPEANQPNTIKGGCPDGTSGTYHVDESLDKLTVSTLDNTPIAEGKTVRVEATVWASASWTGDSLKLYSATNVDASGGPNWSLIATLYPTGPGTNTLSTTFVLPTSSTQAIRGVFFRGPSAWWCSPTGSYDDRDDLMFYVDTHPDPDAPTVSLTSPSEGATLSRSVTLQAAASDNFGVSRVEFYVDGQLLGSATAAPFTYTWASTSLENGSHTLTARAYDIKGNSATSAPVQVILNNDEVPPAISLTSPASGATVSGNVSVQVTASDNDAVVNVQLFVNGQLTYGYSNSNITSASLPWNTRTSGNGNHTLIVTATDPSGNTTASEAVQVIINNDVAAPSVSLTAPASGATLTGTTSLTADVSDNVGVLRVDFYAGTTWLASSSVAPFQASFDSSTLPNGIHSLTARAYDAAGNVGTSAEVLVSVANAGSPGHAAYDAMLQVPACATPGISCDSVALLDGRANLGPEPHTPNTLYSECFDGTSGSYRFSPSLDRLEVSSVDGTPLTQGKPVRIDATVWVSSFSYDRLDLFYAEDVGFPNWTFLGTLAPTANGQQRLSKTYVLPRGARQAVRGVFRYGGSISTCIAGGYADQDDLVFAVTQEPDLVAPTVSLTEPAGGATLSRIATLTASATDNFGVKQVDFYANGIFLGAVTEAPFTTSWGTVSWDNGSCTLTAVASDVAGNITHSEPVQVTVNNDKTAPTVSVTSPTDGATVSGSVSINATASDNVGVIYVEFRVDGTFLGSDATAPYSVTWNSIPSTNGAHTVTAIAHDAAGNQSPISSVQVTVNNDKTAPTVSLTAPAAGATVSGTVTLTATASDNVGVTRVEFLAGGSLLGSDTTAPYQYSWNTTTRANGAVTLQARAYDASGNVTFGSTVSVTVSNLPATGGSLPYSASNTNSAQANTVNQSIALTAGQTLTLGTCGVTGSSFSGDTYLRLYGPSGSQVTFNDDACGGAGSNFTYTVPSGGGGNYQLRAGCYSSNSCSGTVAWTITGGSSTPPPSGSTLTYSASNTNSAQANTVNQTITLAQGQLLTLGTCGVTGASFTGDTYLRLYGPTGSQVTASDDACGGAGSNFTYTVPVGGAGNYQLRAGCYSSGSCSGIVAWTIQ